MNKTIPFNEFKKEYTRLRADLLKIIDRCLGQGQYILGKNVALFEHKFASFIGVKYCIGVGNGAQALEIALRALGIGKGDEVITVSLSAAETVLAISHTGATPVLIDIDDFYHMDPKLIEAAITPKTKAIMPVHLYGQMADIQAIKRITKLHNLFLIEDACQAHGAFDNTQRKAGSIGDVSAFSFYPTKNLGAYGDAGAITTNSKRIYDSCMRLRNSGRKDTYEHAEKGINSRLDELQAAILLYKLPHLTKINKKRATLAQVYVTSLSDIKELTLPNIRANTGPVFHLFVIQTDKRNDLQRYLKTHRVDTRIHFPIPIHKQDCFREFRHLSLPNTEMTTKRILSLPIHPELTPTQIRRVCLLIRKFFARSNK